MSAEQVRIYETFTSLQGESTHAGRLCFFIRMAGCNLNCRFCDTPEAQSAGSGRDAGIQHIVNLAEVSGAKLVEVTGGEPLLQKSTPELCRRLLAEDDEVMVETNGSLSIAPLPRDVIKIVDCKTPSSGESDNNLYDNYQVLSPRDEIKFVIANKDDYEFSLEIIARHQLHAKTANILFSPIWGEITPRQLANWMVRDKSDARFQLQLHKVIWGPNTKGV